MTDTPDGFDNAAFKAFAARLGITTKTVTDTFGRTEILIDRTGMERIRDTATATGFPDIADRVQRILDHSQPAP